jgi:hypothetical protein
MTNRNPAEHQREWVPLMKFGGSASCGHDGSNQSEDVEPDVESGGYPCRNPSGAFLVTDPTFLPLETVERLLAPDADGRVGAMLGNRQLTRFVPYVSDCELTLIASNMMVHEACVCCGFDFRTGLLHVSWKKRVLCEQCMPVEMWALREIGYEWAKEVSVGSDEDLVDYPDALIEFADRHAPKESS